MKSGDKSTGFGDTTVTDFIIRVIGKIRVGDIMVTIATLLESN